MKSIPKNEFPLWTESTPGAMGSESHDIPTLTPFPPDPAVATGAVLVIFPGGGYGHHAVHEGKGYADFFAARGIACFVLKYRLGSHGYRHPWILGDAARAVRLVRANAVSWGLDPKRIGIIGSSAGGHLASTLVTHFDAGKPGDADPVERVKSRPDLAILCYPVITLEGPHSHGGSRENLIGKNPPAELVHHLSSEQHVTPQTPPCFVWHTVEDASVNVENSLMFAAALRRADVPFDLHVYQRGEHGIGLNRSRKSNVIHPWTDDCLFWLGEQRFLKPNTI